MSKNRGKAAFYGKTSQQIQTEFNEVCFRLGQEIGNERRAIDNQEVLKERQVQLEEAFTAAVTREQEEAKQGTQAEANTKAFASKGAKEVADRALAVETDDTKREPSQAV